MKMKATFEVEFDTRDMCSQEDLDRCYSGSWFKCMKYLYEQDGLGIFENDLKLIKVVDYTTSMHKEYYQEDVNELTSKLIPAIEEFVDLPGDLEDKIWNAVQAKIEEFFNYPDYRHHN